MNSLKPEKRKTGRPLSFDRAQALEKAMLAFWRHGYETTSVSDLTSVMGITAPSLYTAYGDKKQLFLEAMQLYAGSPESLELSLNAAATAREAAHEMLLASAKAFTNDATPLGCLLASATASGSEESADVQKAVADIRRDVIRRLEKRIARDVAGGILPDKTDILALATMVVTIIQGMSVLARDGTAREMLINMIEVTMAAWPSRKDLNSH